MPTKSTRSHVNKYLISYSVQTRTAETFFRPCKQDFIQFIMSDCKDIYNVAKYFYL